MKHRIALLILLFTFIFVTGKAQMNMAAIGFIPYSESLSDVWGYVDEEGNEYALVGAYGGLSVVDISDPANPVEVFFGAGPSSIWRDIKTWGDYAYVSNESGDGIYIVDLSPLPGGSIENTTNFTGSTYPFQTVHNIYIDESGRLYIFGSGNGSGGAIICDLTQDPMNPVELGRFNDYYLHDGMARDNTLWGAALYEGVLAAIDVSDPSDPEVLGTVSTPSQFTHNTWVSDDGSHVFTTDEVGSGYIGAFNVTDVTSMFETDRIQSSPGTDVIPHNVHVKDDFLVTSYYADGIVVHDAKYPDKLFEVANFDTSPNYSGYGFNGSWGAYPFLPSGLILASDIETGLYILEIDYIRAAFLEGTVTGQGNGNPLFDVLVEVPAAGLSTSTSFDGTYDFGTILSGSYDVIFSKMGYASKTINDVEFINGEIHVLDIFLENMSVGMDNNALSDAIRTYPNPFNSQIHVKMGPHDHKGGYSFTIVDLSGKEIENISLTASHKEIISLGAELEPGIYFLRFYKQNELAGIKKIIKY